jgi:hypothetical protein
MPIHGYLGGVISATAPTVSVSGASGIFTLEEQMQAAGTWPIAGLYPITRSVRLRSSASAYFNRTPASAGNRKTWTWSGWVKLGSLSTTLNILYAYSADSDSGLCQLSYQSNQLRIQGFSASFLMVSTPVYRDPSAWYHIVYKVDTTQATAADRVRVYVDGVEITAWATNTPPPQNTDTAVNNNVAHNIGRNTRNSNDYLDGYFAEVNLIDGQALTPTSFGEFDVITGVWNPIRYTGTYGTNGFYLNFSDNSAATAATIGKDSSGNGNNWTPNNISVTAGTTYDSMVDSPTNYGTDTGVGGEVRGNYCTFNPLNATDTTFSNGNLRMVTASPGYGRPQLSTFGISSGQKFYAEFVVTSVGASSDVTIGIDDGFIVPAYYSNSGSTSGLPANFRGYRNGGGTYVGSTYTSGSPGVSYTNGDKISVAVDRSANQITYYKNGSSVYTQSIASSVDQYYLCVMTFTGSADLTLNAGQTAFSYTAPSGYKALCTQNFTTPTITNGANYMAATLWTGTGVGSRAITNTSNGVSFQPDWVWLKNRSDAYHHQTNDSVRGATNGALYTSLSNAVDANFGITSFDASGFTLGNTASLISQSFGSQNGSGATFVGWQWKASGSTVSNTSGSITSTVSANTTAGFSVLTYTGTGATATIGHGLGATPSMMIMKKRSNAGSWKVYHTVLGNTKILEMNAVDGAQTSSTYWNNTSPTSTLITVGSNGDINASGETYVSYCWTAISGYSAFISFTGNGSGDGPFVYCGFRPRYLLIKRYDATGDPWWVIDSTRSPYNQTILALRPNSSNAEDSGGNANFDFLANGFKARTSGGGNGNESGATYIVAAFAENPFNISRAR